MITWHLALGRSWLRAVRAGCAVCPRLPGARTSGLAVNSRTGTIYIADFVPNTVSVIRGRTSKVVATVHVGLGPTWIAVNPRTNTVYVANNTFGTISVIRKNKEVARLRLFNEAHAIAVDPATRRIYITNFLHDTVSVFISCRPDDESCE